MGAALLNEIDSTHCQPGEAAIWPLGQCGFALKTCEALFYIDAVLTDLPDAEGKTRRWFPSPFDPEALKADYFLCTHGHRDHLNPETVQRVAEHTPSVVFVVPGGCRKQMKALGIPEERIRFARSGEKMELPGVTIRPVSAAHPVHAVDEQGEDIALSYCIESGGVTILHAGDTYLTERLLQDYQFLPAPDLFFPPINGGDYFRTARNCIGNLNPTEAARLAVMLHAGLTIPTHYDMMKGNTADPIPFVRQLWQEDTSACWKLPALGERVLFRK